MVVGLIARELIIVEFYLRDEGRVDTVTAAIDVYPTAATPPGVVEELVSGNS